MLSLVLSNPNYIQSITVTVPARMAIGALPAFAKWASNRYSLIVIMIYGFDWQAIALCLVELLAVEYRVTNLIRLGSSCN